MKGWQNLLTFVSFQVHDGQVNYIFSFSSPSCTASKALLAPFYRRATKAHSWRMENTSDSQGHAPSSSFWRGESTQLCSDTRFEFQPTHEAKLEGLSGAHH